MPPARHRRGSQPTLSPDTDEGGTIININHYRPLSSFANETINVTLNINTRIYVLITVF